MGKTSLGQSIAGRHGPARSCASRSAACDDEAELPRPPEDVRRRAARPDRARAEEGQGEEPDRAPRRGRQARRRACAARPRRRCWRCSIRSRTRTFVDHYLELPVRSVGGRLPLHGERPRRRSRRRCATGWRSSSCPATRRTRRCAIARSHLVPKQLTEHAIHPRARCRSSDEALRGDRARLHAGGRACGSSSREIKKLCRALALDDGPRGGRQGAAPAWSRRAISRRTWASSGSSATWRSGRRRRWRGHRARLDAGGRGHPVHRDVADAGEGARRDHGPARRRDEGVGEGGAHLRAAATRAQLGDRRGEARGGGPAHPRPGGRRAQGRADRGRDHVHGADVAALRAARALGHGDDRRVHAARAGAPRRRDQVQGARRRTAPGSRGSILPQKNARDAEDDPEGGARPSWSSSSSRT